MNKKHIAYATCFAALLIVLSLTWAVNNAKAANVVTTDVPVTTSAPGADLKFPIKELGGCKDMASCASYCNTTDHMLSCVGYAEKHGLVTAEEAAMSKKVAEKVAKGKTPGGCKDSASCKTYCESKSESMSECVAFAEELGVMSQEELMQAKKVAEALKNGSTLPGSCTSKATCESYCSEGTHINECLSFAEKAGLMTAENLVEAKKIAPFIEKGDTPGKCGTKEACVAYCNQDANSSECIDFAAKAGLVSAEDAELAKKVGGKGPGECKSKEVCATYCNDSSHTDECFAFAMTKGLVSEKDKKAIDEGLQKIRTGLEQVPTDARTEVETCLRNTVGEKYDQIVAGTATPPQDLGEKVGNCFGSAMADYAKKMIQGATQGIGKGNQEEPSNNTGVPEMPMNQNTMQNGGMGVSGSEIPEAPQGGVMNMGGAPVSAPDCSVFAQIPKCSMAGPAGEDICKKCFPGK